MGCGGERELNGQGLDVHGGPLEQGPQETACARCFVRSEVEPVSSGPWPSPGCVLPSSQPHVASLDANLLSVP